ncbi:MAG: ribosome biogenesis GTPase YlqF, partial [Clostridiales bacterium]|nr:ribosome biogenesis GTPase YlqF [Clostridiales bacterium]
MDINWYPGHMAKAKRVMEENLRLIDIIIELLDARAPRSSMNPDLQKLYKNKPRLIVLIKSDLADEQMTKEW